MSAVICHVVLTVVVAALGLRAAGDEGDRSGRRWSATLRILPGVGRLGDRGRSSPAGATQNVETPGPCNCTRLLSPSLPSCCPRTAAMAPRTKPWTTRPGLCATGISICASKSRGNLSRGGKTKLGGTWARQDSCPTSPEVRVANRQSLSYIPSSSASNSVASLVHCLQRAVPPWNQTQSLLLKRKTFPFIRASVPPAEEGSEADRS